MKLPVPSLLANGFQGTIIKGGELHEEAGAIPTAEQVGFDALMSNPPRVSRTDDGNIGLGQPGTGVVAWIDAKTPDFSAAALDWPVGTNSPDRDALPATVWALEFSLPGLDDRDVSPAPDPRNRKSSETIVPENEIPRALNHGQGRAIPASNEDLPQRFLKPDQIPAQSYHDAKARAWGKNAEGPALSSDNLTPAVEGGLGQTRGTGQGEPGDRSIVRTVDTRVAVNSDGEILRSALPNPMDEMSRKEIPLARTGDVVVPSRTQNPPGIGGRESAALPRPPQDQQNPPQPLPSEPGASAQSGHGEKIAPPRANSPLADPLPGPVSGGAKAGPDVAAGTEILARKSDTANSELLAKPVRAANRDVPTGVTFGSDKRPTRSTVPPEAGSPVIRAPAGPKPDFANARSTDQYASESAARSKPAPDPAQIDSAHRSASFPVVPDLGPERAKASVLETAGVRHSGAASEEPTVVLPQKTSASGSGIVQASAPASSDGGATVTVAPTHQPVSDGDPPRDVRVPVRETTWQVPSAAAGEFRGGSEAASRLFQGAAAADEAVIISSVQPFADAVTQVDEDRSMGPVLVERGGVEVSARIDPSRALVSELARPATLQITDALRAAPGSVDVTLRPEELGRVSLTMVTQDGTLTVHMAAERPETLDLLRRHVDLLMQEARAAGFEDVEFGFADQQGFGDRWPGEGPSRSVGPDDHADHHVFVPEQPSNRPVAPASGLDLRL